MSEEDVGTIREVDGFLTGKGDIELPFFGLFVDGSFKSFVVLLSGVDDDSGIGF